MGSGGMIVLDDDTCMVEFSRYFLLFAAAESCGKCVPCRVGGQRLLEALTRISEGHGTRKDLKIDQGRVDEHDEFVAVRTGPAHARAGLGRVAILRGRVHYAHRRQTVPRRPVPGPGAGPLCQHVPRGRGHAGLFGAGGPRPLCRRAGHPPPPQSVRAGLRPRLPGVLRNQVPARRNRRAGGDSPGQTLYGGPRIRRSNGCRNRSAPRQNARRRPNARWR